MLRNLSDFLKHLAFKLTRDPKEFVKVLSIFKDFLGDDKNFTDSTSSLLETSLENKKEKAKIPLTLSPSVENRLKTLLSEYPGVYNAGLIRGMSRINLINVIGQFLTIIRTNIDSAVLLIEQHNIHSKQKIDSSVFEKLAGQFNAIWGKQPLSTNAKTLAKKYHTWSHKMAIDDLQTKINQSIDLIKNSFYKAYEDIKDIP